MPAPFLGEARTHAASPLPKKIHTEAHPRFCAMLIAARKSPGLTQTVVTKRLRNPPSYVAKYELSERRLDVLEFLNLRKRLDLMYAAYLSGLQNKHGHSNSTVIVQRLAAAQKDHSSAQIHSGSEAPFP
jgi:transcriptional regulator with XRE-family HTH domain